MRIPNTVSNVLRLGIGFSAEWNIFRHCQTLGKMQFCEHQDTGECFYPHLQMLIIAWEVFFRLWETLSTEYVELIIWLLCVDKKTFLLEKLQIYCINESIPLPYIVKKCWMLIRREWIHFLNNTFRVIVVKGLLYITIFPEIEQSTDVTSFSVANFFHIWKMGNHCCFQLFSCSIICSKTWNEWMRRES